MKYAIQNVLGFILIFTLISIIGVQAQTERVLLDELVAEDEEAINALVLYPEDTRLAILEATKYPEALIKLENVQSKSKMAFRSLIEQYPQSVQEMIWDLTRYPGMIDRMVNLNNASTKAVNLLLKNYPVVIHDRAKIAFKNYYWELSEIRALNLQAEATFTTLLNEYPEETQKAFQHLIKLPEVLSILTDNIRLTILIGDLYKKNPHWVSYQLDSLNLVVARENAKELEDWQRSLEEDPQVLEEFKSSAESFSEEHSYYYDDYYDQSFDDVYYEEKEAREIHNYHYYNYPYWFSYPHWYHYPRWRQYPYWYDWGFYFGLRRGVVIIGLPSFYFTDWYFYHPYHHYRWSNLSAHFTQHYYGHRRHGSSITASVTLWQSRNQAVISKEWLHDDKNLSQRFKEFGKFESDRARYNRSHPDKQMDQLEFKNKNPNRYQSISGSREISKRITGVEERTRIPTNTKRQTESNTKKTTKSTFKKKIQAPSTKIPTVKKGTEQHRSISERTKATRTVKPVPPKTKATPRSKVSKPRTIKKKTIPRKKKNNN